MIKSLILGSSHAQFGFIPNFYSAYSFNLGIPSCDLAHCCYLLEKITNPQSKYYAPQLSEVILYFSYFHFSYNLYKSKPNFLTILLSLFFETPKPCIIINEREIKRTFKRDKAYFSYCMDNAIKYHGYYPYCPYFYKEKEKNIQKYNHTKLKFRWCPSTQFEWLEKIACICKQLNLKLYIVLPPYQKPLLSGLTNEFETIISQQIKQVYHTKLFNFTSDASFMPEDFFDNGHLDIFGAEKLTKKIKLLIEHTK